MDSSSPSSRQIRLVVILFAAVVAVLGAGYYFFLRTDYSVLFADLRPAEASAIVAELDTRAVPYVLRDGGATILVPAEEAAAARLAIAGSDVPLRGMVGFELFNESDMGLTDFAQKVNYQRALQGELARTIMTMEGVESARVHLAIPERALFRAARSAPKASVTVIPRRGRTLEEGRVIGIQRLVASAVTELSLADVVVLDERGRVISPSAADLALPPELEERGAVERYYRARARGALENLIPGMKSEVRVTAVSDGTLATPVAAPAAGAARDFRLRIVVITETPLNAEDRAAAGSAISSAVGLEPGAGDSLAFAVGPVGLGATPPAAAPVPAVSVAPAAAQVPADRSDLWWAVLAALIAIVAIAALVRPRRAPLSDAQRADFVERIRTELDRGEGSHARA